MQQQPVGKGGHVGVHQGAGGKFRGQRLATVFFALAREHQVGHAPSGGTGLQIAQGVAHRWHAGQLHAVAFGDLFKQARRRFAAMAVVIRAVRAIKHRIDAPTGRRQKLVHLGVHGVEGGHVIQTSP